MFLFGDVATMCIGAAADLREWVSARESLAKCDNWRQDAIGMQVGKWRAFLAELPRSPGASITKGVDDLLIGDRQTLSGDILSWWILSFDGGFSDLPRLSLWLGEDRVTIENTRQLALQVLEQALGFRITMLVRESWRGKLEGVDGCHLLWRVVKMIGCCGDLGASDPGRVLHR